MKYCKTLFATVCLISKVCCISTVVGILTFTNNVYATPPTEAYFCVNYGRAIDPDKGGLKVERHRVNFVGSAEDFGHVQSTAVFVFYAGWRSRAVGSSGNIRTLPAALIKKLDRSLVADNGFLSQAKAKVVEKINASLPENGDLYAAPLFQDVALLKGQGPNHGAPFTLGRDWLGRGTEVYGLKAFYNARKAAYDIVSPRYIDQYLELMALEKARSVIRGMTAIPMLPGPGSIHLSPLPLSNELRQNVRSILDIQAYKRRKLEEAKGAEDAYVDSFFQEGHGHE